MPEGKAFCDLGDKIMICLNAWEELREFWRLERKVAYCVTPNITEYEYHQLVSCAKFRSDYYVFI